MKFLTIIMSMLLICAAVNAVAQEENVPAAAEPPEAEDLVIADIDAAWEDTYTIPDICDFKMTFPEEPLVEKHCFPIEQEEGKESEGTEPKETCVEKISFIKVFFGKATIEINAICRNTKTEDYERYTEEIMQKTLVNVIKPDRIEDYQVYSSSEDNYRYAFINGIADNNENGFEVSLLHLWVSPKSLLNVEAYLKGVSDEYADIYFSRIMRSIEHAGESEAP